MTSPSDPPPKVEDAESKSDSIKSRSKLTGTKSLGILESSRVSTSPEADDEYIEMDPVYAPVAPDEHNESERKLNVTCTCMYTCMYMLIISTEVY